MTLVQVATALQQTTNAPLTHHVSSDMNGILQRMRIAQAGYCKAQGGVEFGNRVMSCVGKELTWVKQSKSRNKVRPRAVSCLSETFNDEIVGDSYGHTANDVRNNTAVCMNPGKHLSNTALCTNRGKHSDECDSTSNSRTQKQSPSRNVKPRHVAETHKGGHVFEVRPNKQSKTVTSSTNKVHATKDHFLVGRKLYLSWTDLNGQPKEVYGEVIACNKNAQDGGMRSFTVAYTSQSQDAANSTGNSCISLVPQSQKLPPPLALLYSRRLYSP